MEFPEVIRVKLSSEEAVAVSFTAVVIKEMTARELVEQLLAIAGKDPERIREFLLRGTAVDGATRYRWDRLDIARERLDEVLGTFPDPDPSRPFQAERCVKVVFRGPRGPMDLPREAAAKRRFLRRANYWDVLMELVSGGEVEYAGYCYRENADRYRLRLEREAATRLREYAARMAYSGLEARIRNEVFEEAELFVRRETA
jgi:hypothetical protein